MQLDNKSFIELKSHGFNCVMILFCLFYCCFVFDIVCFLVLQLKGVVVKLFE
jgi:hypothetical protein